MAESYAVHKATRNTNYGPYDPLDFEMEPDINPAAKYGGESADSFPSHYMAPTGAVDLVGQGQNKDSRAGISYGSGVDNKPSKGKRA